MASYPVGTVRARLEEVIAEASSTDQPVMLTREDDPVAVILAIEHYDSLTETLAVLSDPHALREIREAERDVAAGRASDETAVRAALAARLTRPTP